VAPGTTDTPMFASAGRLPGYRARVAERAALGEVGTAHGVAELVRVAARELGPFGIRVNAVAPGTTDTPMFASTTRLPGYRARVSERAALGDVGTAHGVAQAIVAMLGLDWVTGQVLAADGGVSLWSPIDPAESLGP